MEITEYSIILATGTNGTHPRIEFKLVGPLGMAIKVTAWTPIRPDDPESLIRMSTWDSVRGTTRPVEKEHRGEITAMLEAHPVIGPAAKTLGFLPNHERPQSVSEGEAPS